MVRALVLSPPIQNPCFVNVKLILVNTKDSNLNFSHQIDVESLLSTKIILKLTIFDS